MNEGISKLNRPFDETHTFKIELEMIQTTLNRIYLCNPSKELWDRLLKSLGKTQPDDDALDLYSLIHRVGLYSALWCCQSLPEFDKYWRLYAIWCARQLKCNHKYGMYGNESFVKAIEVAERYANGDATQAELHEAWVSSGLGGSSASATTEENAALAAQKAAQLAVEWATHFAGIEARLSLPKVSDQMEAISNAAVAYDTATKAMYPVVKEKQKQEFFKTLERISKEKVRAKPMCP
ncbi:MAG TPA: hypothetical protein VMW07_09730 [Gallionella sp.]|nr:hypothetical protein [Gallionella sp.]